MDRQSLSSIDPQPPECSLTECHPRARVAVASLPIPARHPRIEETLTSGSPKRLLVRGRTSVQSNPPLPIRAAEPRWTMPTCEPPPRGQEDHVPRLRRLRARQFPFVGKLMIIPTRPPTRPPRSKTCTARAAHRLLARLFVLADISGNACRNCSAIPLPMTPTRVDGWTNASAVA